MNQTQEEVNKIDGVTVHGVEEINLNAPVEGIYRNVPFDIYEKIDALNSSKIRQACKSAKMYKRYLLQKEKEESKTSEALEFGRAFALICEDPEGAKSKIQEGPTKTFGTKAWMEQLEANPEIIYVKPDALPMLDQMAEALYSHKYAGRYVGDECAENELTIVWRHVRTGRFLKGRIDIYSLNEVIDVKTTTTKDINPDKLKWSIKDYRYDVQATMYFDGMAALGAKPNGCSLFFVEKHEVLPDVVFRAFNPEEMQEARDDYNRALDRIIEGEETGYYAGYEDGVIVPLWGFDEPTVAYD